MTAVPPDRQSTGSMRQSTTAPTSRTSVVTIESAAGKLANSSAGATSRAANGGYPNV